MKTILTYLNAYLAHSNTNTTTVSHMSTPEVFYVKYCTILGLKYRWNTVHVNILAYDFKWNIWNQT